MNIGKKEPIGFVIGMTDVVSSQRFFQRDGAQTRHNSPKIFLLF
jgi:hypothetical protein